MSDIKLISTSQLAKKLSLQKQTLDEHLFTLGFIDKKENEVFLTQAGMNEGAKYVTHEKYGKYIGWPEHIQLEKLDNSNNHEYLSSTSIGKVYEFSARKVNMMLSELGWVEKYIKGWKVTNIGAKNGGIQKENSQNGIPYVEWPKSILDNTSFLAVIKEVQGEASCETKEKVEKSNECDFRTKFEAKHRATDGHFVRSKAEMLIDNWLYMAEIVHAYERKLPIEEEVYCDFYIPTGKVYIEFWGLEDDPRYEVRKRIKKSIYEKYGFKLIELTDNDVFNLDDVLPKMLLKFGVQTY